MLYDHIQNNDVKAVAKRLEHPETVSFTQTGLDGYTILHEAVKQERPEIVKLFLLAGADPDRRGSWSFTPLHTAGRYGSPKSTLELIKGGADMDLQSSIGLTPLILAVINNEREVMQTLLDNGADVAMVNWGANYSAYCLAILPGKEPELAEIIIAHAGNVENAVKNVRNYKEKYNL